MQRLFSGLIAASLLFTSSAMAQELKIGLSLPDYPKAAAIREGVLKAQEDHNRQGLRPGPIAIIQIYEGPSPENAYRAGQRLNSESVRYVIADFPDPEAFNAVREFYRDKQILVVLAATATHPEFTDDPEYWNVIRLGRRDDAPGALRTKLFDPRISGDFSLRDKFGDPTSGGPGAETRLYEMYGYAAVQVIVSGIMMGGVDSAMGTARTIRERYIETVLGQLEFDDNGDVTDAALNGDSAPDCPTCPESGNCPEYVIAAKEECCRSGNCPE